jgi:uncharacterized protein (TIGR03000 family)
MGIKSICGLSLASLSTVLILGWIAHARSALPEFEASAGAGPAYSVGETEAVNLIVTDNRRNALHFYTIDKGEEAGAPLKLRGTIDLTQVGKPVVKLTNAGGSSGNAATANLTFVVPADAQVFFDDALTKETGTERIYVTPPLELGKTYTYSVRVRWQENGKTVQQTRTVDVSGGGNVRVDFTRSGDRN